MSYVSDHCNQKHVTNSDALDRTIDVKQKDNQIFLQQNGFIREQQRTALGMQPNGKSTETKEGSTRLRTREELLQTKDLLQETELPKYDEFPLAELWPPPIG